MKILNKTFRYTVVFIFLAVVNTSFTQNEKSVFLTEKEMNNLSNDSLLVLAGSYFLTDTKSADIVLDLIIRRAKSTNSIKLLYEVYRCKGANCETQSQLHDALKYFTLAAESIENQDISLFISAQLDKAIVNRKLQNYPEARSLYLSVLELCKKNNDIKNAQNALCGLGNLYDNAGDYENGIRYYKEALKEAEGNNTTENICIYLNNLAEEYSKNKQYQEALATIEKAYNIAKPSKDTETKVYIGTQYAQILADLGRFDAAFAKIDEALSFAEGEYKKRYINNLTITKGEIFLKQKNTSAAEAVFKSCIARPMNVMNLTKLNYFLGKIYQDNGVPNQAKPFYIASQVLAEKNELPRYDEWCHRALYVIYKNEKQGNLALFHLEKANMLRDSLFSFEKSGKVTELQFRYDLAQGEQKIKEVELSSSRNMMLIGGFSTFLIIASLLYIMRMRSKTYKDLKYKNQEIEAQKSQLEIANQAMQLKNQEIEAQKKLLEDSNGMLRQFSYSVAHDLKEPLRSINSFIKIIQRKYAATLPDDSKDYFNFVTSGADRMAKMLEGLLRYSMMSMSQNADIETFSMYDVVQEVVDSLHTNIKERNANIVFKTDIPEVTMNRLHAIQLIQNLVSNALKFVEKSPIIEIESHFVGENVVLSIKDNGIGIEKESGAKLFQLFHRLHRDSSRFEGTGVGLALCKNIVEKYDGKIWFESEENIGTQFFMELPKAA